jgi:hypothetical protein
MFNFLMFTLMYNFHSKTVAQMELRIQSTVALKGLKSNKLEQTKLHWHDHINFHLKSVSQLKNITGRDRHTNKAFTQSTVTM